MGTDLRDKEKFKPIDNKEPSVLESLCGDKLMMNGSLGVWCTSNCCGGVLRRKLSDMLLGGLH